MIWVTKFNSTSFLQFLSLFLKDFSILFKEETLILNCASNFGSNGK